MAASARPRRYQNSNMPAASNDRSQPSAAFMSNLYPNNNIWSLPNTRDRAIASRDSDEGPSGSSALNANSESNVWGSNPWNPEKTSRPTSTSPNRTRDGALSNGAGFLDGQQPSVGLKKTGYGGNAYQDDTNGYSAFASQRRGPDSSFMDSMSTFVPSRDSLPPSRHSQGSPAYSEQYSHTPNNSIQSQRPVSTHSSSLQHQSANQRAFNLNRQLDDDLALQFARRVTLDNGAGSSASSFNPASQPFQMNPSSQPWVNETGGSRFNSVDLGSDPLISHLQQPLKRGSIDRISPAQHYRANQESNSPRGYGPATDLWTNNRPSSRDLRTTEPDRRTPAQQYNPAYQPQYYANLYPYSPVATQYPPNILDPYLSNVRPHPITGYGLPIHPGYALNIPVRNARDQDPTKGVRSALLDEFRQSKSKRYDLKDIYNHLVEFSGDQHGSRFIQQKLETANSDEKDQVFAEIEPNAIQLMKDVFGNYVIQKLFEFGSQVQKKILAEKMRGKVVDLSVQVYACRVVQKAFEHVLVEQQAELTKELEPEIVRVIKDQNGNHVVQKIIELVPRQHLEFIMTALKNHVIGFSSNAYGCRIIQRMLEYGTEDDKDKIMSELNPSIQILLTDQYGNYVTQHVIEHGKAENRERIIQLVMPQVLTLSKHKFASNVVEKCIEHGSSEQRAMIRQQFTTPGSDGVSPLQQLIRDQYGNYVIQKLLAQLEGTERELLVEQIKPQYYNLRKNGSSRQLQAMEKLLGLGATAKNGSSGLHDDINSSIPTPLLTNETNSPQSSSPPSTNASAVGFPSSDGAKMVTNVNGAPRVEGNEI